MSVCSLTADVSLLLGCTTAVSASDVLFLLRLGLDLRLIFLGPTFAATSESNTIHDNGIDIVSSELHVIEY